MSIKADNNGEITSAIIRHMNTINQDIEELKKSVIVFSLCTLELCGTAVTCAVISVRAASIAVSPEEILYVWYIMHNASM